LILVWGISWPVAKIGLQYMPALWFSAYRLIIGTFTMFPMVLLLGKLVLPRKKDLKIILIFGIIQIAIFMSFLNAGLYYIDAGKAAILVYTTPIWVVPISIFFFKEESTGMKWIGFLFGIIGILILFNPFEINWHNRDEIFGSVLLLTAALSWAIAILCARYMEWTRPPLELISWQLLVGTIPVVILAMILQPHPQMVWNNSLILSLIYSGIFATGFAYWGTIVVSKELPPTTTSLSLLAVPICGLIFSAILLHEKITLSILCAMLFILGGLLCVIIRRKV